MSLAEDAKKAREMGLSYGKYIARYGKSPEQVRREAEARRDSDADRVIRRSYAHAEDQTGTGTEHTCMNCGKKFSSYKVQKFCCRTCYNDYYRMKKLERRRAKPSPCVRIDRARFLQELDRQELTQCELAKMARCSEGTICNIGRGAAVWRKTAQKIADALGVPVGFLIGEEM